ncbi:MAG: ATP synthase F1 subunit epsilon [Nitrospirae bacterium RIFCSPLOWO2_12_FULL_63_8]|nr:MAG: ATP synthase F1 subunit epsilon [Nitrospirae bacterium RIFCSPLOWO2_12_FULL_63_8]
MTGKILLEVVTPEHLLLSKQVDEVIAPGSEGEFGVLPGHAPFISMLKIGELRYKIGDAWSYMAVLWGYAEVNPTKVTILAEIAEKAEDIDVERATKKVAEAEQRLAVGGLPSELKEAQISLEKARLRKRIAERNRR